MAKKDLLANAGGMTVAVQREEKKYDGPMASVKLPKLENLGGGGMMVDQYEHVTISNETGMEKFAVQRGIRVDVPVPVFLQLYEKYGDEIL